MDRLSAFKSPQHTAFADSMKAAFAEPMKVPLSGSNEMQSAMRAASLANHHAALVLENDRLCRENMMMRLQTLCFYAPPGLPDPWLSAPADLGSAGESTASGESSAAEDDEQESSDTASASFSVQTTVMMRNLPNNMTCEQFLKIIDKHGFTNSLSFVYLPIDFKSRRGLGYAFVDLKNGEAAESFFSFFQGFDNWEMRSLKVCEATWSSVQGVESHVDLYRNSPVMHESVPEMFKPMLFMDGQRIPFPAPTKRVKAPRQWSRRN